MSIAAQSEGANLEISWENSADAWKSVAGITTIKDSNTGFSSTNYQNVKLLPTHYVASTSDTFYDKVYDTVEGADKKYAVGDWAHTFSNDYNKVASENDYTYLKAQMEKVVAVDTTAPATTTYALVVPIYLRMNPDSTNGIKDLTAKATIGTSATDSDEQKMLAAARVLYVTSDGTIVGTGAASGATVEGLGTVAAPTSTGSAVTTIYAVIYIDGEDSSCKSANYNTNDWTISIEFNGTIVTA